MIKIENVITPTPEQWKMIINGTRNPMFSNHLSDTKFDEEPFEIGVNDYKLLRKLCIAGSDHRKFMRMVVVYLDITAPLYWWKEFDTYKVGSVANSTSTMHKIHSKEFTLEDFSCEHLSQRSEEKLDDVIDTLNYYRDLYNNGGEDYISDNNIKEYEPKDKEVWWQLIQLLPSSFNQKRTVMLNYEVLKNIYHARLNHKLDEWNFMTSWIESLPYSSLITV